jgi:hypothetical protein
MRKIIGGLAAAVAAVGIAAPAQAFNNSHSPRFPLLAHLQQLGYLSDPADDALNVRAGQWICQILYAGHPVNDVQTALEAILTPKGYTLDQADGLVNYAHADLCPHAGKQ